MCSCPVLTQGLRTATFCALGFAGFFWLLMNCEQFNRTRLLFTMKLKFPEAKPMFYREGNVVYISRFRTKYRPAELLLRYMSAAGIDTSSTLPFFRLLIFHKTTNSYALRSSALSYSSFREAFNSALKSLGYDAREYGLHSLRSGGVSQVVHNRKNDVSERLLKYMAAGKRTLPRTCMFRDSGEKIKGYATLRALDFSLLHFYSLCTSHYIFLSFLFVLTSFLVSVLRELVTDPALFY